MLGLGFQLTVWEHTSVRVVLFARSTYFVSSLKLMKRKNKYKYPRHAIETLRMRANLKTIAAFRFLPHNIHHSIDQLGPFRVVTFGKVVASSSMSENEIVRSEDINKFRMIFKKTNTPEDNHSFLLLSSQHP